MFSRVQYEHWHTIIPMVAFALTFTVFVYFFVRALRMQRTKADAMSNLPLENDDTPRTRP
jgi:hypothetical protein